MRMIKCPLPHPRSALYVLLCLTMCDCFASCAVTCAHVSTCLTPPPPGPCLQSLPDDLKRLLGGKASAKSTAGISRSQSRTLLHTNAAAAGMGAAAGSAGGGGRVSSAGGSAVLLLPSMNSAGGLRAPLLTRQQMSDDGMV